MFSINKKNNRFMEIFDAYYALMCSTINLKVSNPDDAEDIAQNVFHVMYEKLDQVDDVRKWLYGAIKYEVLKYYRKKNADINIDDIFDDVAVMYFNGFRDTRIILDEALNSITGEHGRLVIDLIAVQRFTYDEAAGELGMSYRQVRYLYERTVREVLHYLRKKGIYSIEELL